MRLGWRSLGAGVALAALVGVPASAHETRTVGALRLTIGWGEEPAYSGLKNSVDIGVSDSTGAAVTDPSAALTVAVVFGDEQVSLPLRASDPPGVFRATIVPTRAGAYSFHVSGTVAGQAIDVTSGCSDRTFDCVVDAGEVQFPAKDPPAGQLATRLDRELGRADRAEAAAKDARQLAVGAAAVAGLAILIALAVALRKGRRAT